MPSWKVHKEIGKIILNFYNHEIDQLIDSEDHDAGRYDNAVLSWQFEYVWSKWGWEGICYYVLHHVLDRIQDITVSEICDLGEFYLYGELTRLTSKSVWRKYKHLYGSPVADKFENAYKLFLENVLNRVKTDYYILRLAKTGDEKRDNY